MLLFQLFRKMRFFIKVRSVTIHFLVGPWCINVSFGTCRFPPSPGRPGISESLHESSTDSTCVNHKMAFMSFTNTSSRHMRPARWFRIRGPTDTFSSYVDFCALCSSHPSRNGKNQYNHDERGSREALKERVK